MKSVILKSLESNSTTIIPSFGAIMKMGKSTLFNEFLKYDDGKLADVYASEKNVSIDEAKENINKFVTEVNSQLTAKGFYELEDIGSFSKVGGKLKFAANKVKEKSKSISKSTTQPISKKEKPVQNIEKPKIKQTVEVKEVTPEKVEIKPISSIKTEKIEEIKPPKAVISSIEGSSNPVTNDKKKGSSDFLKDDAISKIKAFTNKQDLVDFTREEKRKTVIDVLNKKLDSLNSKNVVTEVTKEEEKIAKPILVTKKTTPIVNVEAKKEKIIEKVTPIVSVKKTKIEIKKPEVKVEKPIVKVDVKKPDLDTETSPKISTPKVQSIPVVEKVETNKEEIKKSAVDETVVAAISKGLDKTEKETKKRKRRKRILWLAILCLLIGAGIFGFLKQDIVKGWFGMNHEMATTNSSSDEKKDIHTITPVEKTEGNIDDAEIDTNESVLTTEIERSNDDSEAPTEEIIETNSEVVPEQVKEVPVATVSSATGSYHIVAGSYSSEANAKKKVKKLNKLGYNEAAVLGKFGGLYKVKIASYDTREAAKAAKAMLKSKDISSAIKKY